MMMTATTCRTYFDEGFVGAGAGPEGIAALLEGESLFNDASSIVLFEIFLQVRGQGGLPNSIITPRWYFMRTGMAYLVYGE